METGTLFANCVVFMLEKMLKVEANTVSCGLVYQPKAPKNLQKYRRKAKCEAFF